MKKNKVRNGNRSTGRESLVSAASSEASLRRKRQSRDLKALGEEVPAVTEE